MNFEHHYHCECNACKVDITTDIILTKFEKLMVYKLLRKNDTWIIMYTVTNGDGRGHPYIEEMTLKKWNDLAHKTGSVENVKSS